MIGVFDADAVAYPNLALMKIAAWHRARNEPVEWYLPLRAASYDRVYASKVFTYTRRDVYLPPGTVKGGSGYDIKSVLPDEIEHTCPDYSLYGIKHSMGFLTRGCIRDCPWCIVPQKEGRIRAHADVEEFARHRDVVLMDNNVLAHPHGVGQIEKMARLGFRVDFNQGLDARLIDDGIARLLSKLRWLHPLRLACDDGAQIEAVRRAVERLRWHNVTPRRYSCYVLVKDIEDALERVRFLKGMAVDPFVQPYRGPEGTEPTAEQQAFARWANHKAEFWSRTWEEYRANPSRGPRLVLPQRGGG